MKNTTDRKLLSISVPVFNEAPNIEPLLARLRRVLDNLEGYDFEIVFTDNASTDDTFEKLADAARQDPRIRVLRFSRNFGFQKSILANYLETRGDAAIQIDADLQDPPELIPEMIRLWEEGNKVVYGIRSKRVEGWPKRHATPATSG
jgi:glycosyltransferase involved in cell wall biosynthesis